MPDDMDGARGARERDAEACPLCRRRLFSGYRGHRGHPSPFPVLSQSFPVLSQSFPAPFRFLARSVVCSTSVHNFSFERPYLCSFGCSSALSALLIRPWRIFDSSCRRETETEEDPSIRDLRRIVCTRHRFSHVREFHPYLDIRYD